jgi:leader peptidase (prepilin peptidase)/N-methyltransferase
MTFLTTLVSGYPYLCLLFAFSLGAIIGSFLNVCIYRLPREKSIFWPGSRCGSCLQPIRWYDNIPLVSYWRLGGKCRTCGAAYSSRYFWIEFLTGVCFAGLFWLEVVHNIRSAGVLPFVMPSPTLPGELVVIWLYHAVFVSFLIVCTFTDFDLQEIPWTVTVPGTLVGVLGGTIWPWPWPMSAEVVPAAPHWEAVRAAGWDALGVELSRLPIGLQPWPVWIPVPAWMAPGTWPLGLITALVGAAVGSGLIRLIRFVFTWGLGKEAMGLGDADLMMMIGAFLGWQAPFVVLVFAVFLGLLYAIVLIVRYSGSELPFGPFLAGGAVLTMLTPWWWHAMLAGVFFNFPLLVALSLAFSVLAFVFAMLMRMLRLIAQAA